MIRIPLQLHGPAILHGDNHAARVGAIMRDEDRAGPSSFRS